MDFGKLCRRRVVIMTNMGKYLFLRKYVEEDCQCDWEFFVENMEAEMGIKEFNRKMTEAMVESNIVEIVRGLI